MDKRELYYFNKAKKISRISTYDRVRIGCIAVYKKNIIGIGYNTRKTSPIQSKYNTLGKRILRTETAGLTTLSILMYHLECESHKL